MTAPNLKLEKIGQVAVPVKNLARAVEFYRDRLGMQFLFEAPGMAFFQLGEVRLLLTLPEGDEDAPAASILYYTVSDIQAAYGSLVEGGVEILEKPTVVHRTGASELWMTFFRDTEQNTVALMSEIVV